MFTPFFYSIQSSSLTYLVFLSFHIVPDTDSGGHLSNLLYTVIPCVVFGMVVAIVIIAVCWKQHKQGPGAIKKNTRMTVTVLLPEVIINAILYKRFRNHF